MDKKVFFLPVIAVTTFLSLLFVFTKLFGPIPFSVTSVTTQKSTTFDVTGEGKVTIKPDTASVTVGIQAKGTTVKTAQEQINSVINKVSSSIKNMGVDSKDIETTNYNINPEYDYSAGQTIKGYVASTNLQIKVHEVDKVNQVIDLATANGANQVNSVTFDVKDREKAESEARQKAVDNAKKKAQEASRIAGFKLGRIVNYSENFGGNQRIMPMVALDKAAGNNGTPTQVESGSTDVSVVVSLSYSIE